jgi:TonB family protein
VRSEILESSGEPEYDKRALRAINATKDFPPVPETIVGRVMQGDIVLGFPL